MKQRMIQPINNELRREFSAAVEKDCLWSDIKRLSVALIQTGVSDQTVVWQIISRKRDLH